MKSCPTCNRTFEDTFTFCLADGSLLDAPFDPHATLIIPEPRQTEPPPTEVLRPEIPPTIASPEPQQKRQELLSTIAAPASAYESPKIKPLPAHPARKSNRRVRIIMAILVLLIIGAVTLYKVINTASRHENNGIQLENSFKLAEAEVEYRKAIELEPNVGRYHWRLGWLLEELKRYPEAEAQYREALRLEPSSTTYQDYLKNFLDARAPAR
jgi:tetratricopeptide (TPR) repeat protein